VTGLEITQVLDERDLGEGLLTLEIKATGKGLVPELPTLLRTNWPGLELAELSDEGLAITHIDTEGEDVTPVSERNWLLKLQLAGKASTGMTFKFPESLRSDVKQVFKRYADADLVEVEPEIALAGVVIQPRPLWQKAVLSATIAAVFAIALLLIRRRATAQTEAAPRYVLPETLTPFNVIALLRKLKADPDRNWSEAQRTELAATIQTLESHYFSHQRNGNPEPDLKGIGTRWIAVHAPVG
jgi:hypothetical protein